VTAKVSPLDRIEPVVRAGIPIFGVSGDADESVPYEENLAVLVKKYRAAGGLIEVIIKPGGKHHPHSLTEPRADRGFPAGAHEALTPAPGSAHLGEGLLEQVEVAGALVFSRVFAISFCSRAFFVGRVLFS